LKAVSKTSPNTRDIKIYFTVYIKKKLKNGGVDVVLTVRSAEYLESCSHTLLPVGLSRP
jgi:hypothetical protein